MTRITHNTVRARINRMQKWYPADTVIGNYGGEPLTIKSLDIVQYSSTGWHLVADDKPLFGDKPLTPREINLRLDGIESVIDSNYSRD